MKQGREDDEVVLCFVYEQADPITEAWPDLPPLSQGCNHIACAHSSQTPPDISTNRLNKCFHLIRAQRRLLGQTGHVINEVGLNVLGSDPTGLTVWPLMWHC